MRAFVVLLLAGYVILCHAGNSFAKVFKFMVPQRYIQGEGPGLHTPLPTGLWVLSQQI